MEINALILVQVLLAWRGGLLAFPLPLPWPAHIRRLELEDGASN
jgi:hypothetical protein